MQHVYDVGYSSYEDSAYCQYMHSEKYSDKELRKIVEDCMFETIVWHAENREGEFCGIQVGKCGPTFSELLREDQFQEAMKRHGFVPLFFTASFSCFGWPSSMDPDHWGGDRSNEDKELASHLRDRIAEAGIVFESFVMPPDDEEDDSDESFRTYRRLVKKEKVDAKGEEKSS